MYEKIFNKLKSLGVDETLEKLVMELNQARWDVKIVKDTLENLKTIFDSNSHFEDYNDTCHYVYDDFQKCSSLLQNSLEIKIKN